MSTNTEHELNTSEHSRFDCRRMALPMLASAVLSMVILGPFWLSSWISGFLISAGLWILLNLCVFAGGSLLVIMAAARLISDIRKGRRTRAILWLSIGIGVVAAFHLMWIGVTPSYRRFFGHGLVTRLDIQSGVGAVRTWVASLDPNDCAPMPHGNPRGRYLQRGTYPKVLKHHNGFVQLEPDAEGRPSVRLAWDQSKAGRFGLVIGTEDMKTPPSEPGTYGQKRTELRPGVYFWYEEA